MVFTARYRGAVCDVGLWRYSRHPNYFAEWLVWTGLVVVAVPSWLARQAAEPWPIWISIGVGSLGASVTMYITLVYLTGAIPAEYYSATKREGYREYQRRTNMFFPWWPRTDSNHAAASLRASLRGLCRRESDQLPP
jgi:steroid 5-alpha reductase family enzyme